jgi:hypothetical protein
MGDAVTDWSTANHIPAGLPGPQAPRLIRTLWVMTRQPNKSITAGIYDNPYGRELRVYYGQDENNVVSTSLSRTGEAPLEQEAATIRAVLEEQGWTPTA